MHIDRDVYDGQNKNHFIRIQFRYMAIFLGEGWWPKGWSGLHIGIFAPAHHPSIGYCLMAFYCSLLPGLPGPPARTWPKWYLFLHKQMSFRRVLKLKRGWE